MRASSKTSTGGPRIGPEYRALYDGVDVQEAAESVHEGYFSIDRRGGWTDTAENNQTHRDNAERAYRLIMRDKEKLLASRSPCSSFFSHFGVA